MSWLTQIWNSGPGWLLTRFTFLGLFFGTGKPWINWAPSPQLGFQAAHFFAAGWAVYTLDKLFNWPWLATGILIVVLAAIKEFIIDIKIIEGDGYLSSAWDFTWYVVGVLATTHMIRHW